MIPRIAPQREEISLRWPNLDTRQLVLLAFALRGVPLDSGPTIADIREQIALRELRGAS